MANQQGQSTASPQWGPVVYLREPQNPAAAPDDECAQSAPAHICLPDGFLVRHGRWLRRVGICLAAAGGLVVLGCFALWWRLASGPIQLDIVTPWLAAAIEQNFGSSHHVEVGGTQIERTENGGTAVRIRDIVVRDADGTVVASAPKAEVHVSGIGLLSGQVRAESLNLVGAEMAVRIEQDGNLTVFAGADKHPIATASVAPATAAVSRPRFEKTVSAAMTAAPTPAAPATVAAGTPKPTSRRDASAIFAALLAWIDGIGETGLDGHELGELGLKNGNLTVDDERTGKHLTFHDISLSVERTHGGVEVTVGSDNSARPWAATASITPTGHGSRKIELEARQISIGDLLLASRLGGGDLQTDMPLSASIKAEIGSDGVPQSLSGRIVMDAGSIGDADGADGRLAIDHAEFRLNWDAASHTLTVPFQVLSGGNRITLMGRIEAPQASGGIWSFRIGGGTAVLVSPAAASQPLILNRIALAGDYDPAKHRFVLDEGDIGSNDLGVALSGKMDFSGGELRLAAGLAGTRMPVESLKRLWPVFVAPKVRDWFMAHLSSGTVDRIVLAVNAPFETLKASGPPIPDDGLSVDALASGCVVRPADGLPPLRDADLNIHIVGRDAVISLAKATADLPSGRKLALSSGVFEVPDTAPHEPPARVRFKVDGPVAAAAELLHMDRLRDVSDTPFEASSMHGTMSAMVSLTMPLKADLPPGATNYSVAVDATNFAADHMIMGQKVEAATLRATATPQGFQLKGEVRIGGMPATLEYRKLRSEPEAEVHVTGMLDEAARSNLGLDSNNAISGAIPIRLAGRLAAGPDRDGRFAVEADLTPAQIDGFLPGWVKPSGKPARATFTLTTKPHSIRIDDLLIEGAGTGVKGSIDLDGSGQVQSANFTSYGFSDGDRTTLRAERAGDGALRVVMRGEVYDGRGFVKEAAGGPPSNRSSKHPPLDVDLDVKLAAVVGFNGEALRSLDLRMSRRAGRIRTFDMSAKIGRNATLTGDLRARSGGHQVVFLDTGDAGAFFRFVDIYSRITGGTMSIAMDPPSADVGSQLGLLSIRDFAVHDEAQLTRAVADAPQGYPNNKLDFSSLRVEFTRTPGRVSLRDGVVRGPLLGGTIDGMVDYARDEVHLRGTLVPLYGPNNFLGQLPLVGLFLGGQKEGLVGITYEVVGRPGQPVLNVNPFSALAPGLLRKVFEFPAAAEEGAATGSR